MADFVSLLQHYRQLVWPIIEKQLSQATEFPDYCRISPKYSNLLQFHQELISNYPLRFGKYLRPSLVILTAQAMGCPLKRTLTTAAAMQLSEEWVLCHDDIEDNSLERRGAPTLHRLYGPELAINAGDHLQTLQWKLLLDNFSLLGPEMAGKITDEFLVMFNRTFLGQTIDIKWNQDKEIILTDEDVFLTFESKTGYYTIAGPMRLGAILAGATPKELDKIYRFGVYLGRVFQIIDDYLDLTSDFKGLKKQQGNDIYENKKTIMLIDLIRKVDGDDKLKLGLILSKNRDAKTPEDVQYVIGLMRKYGCLEYTLQLARQFSTECLHQFDTDLQFLEVEPFRGQLKAGIDFIVNRDH